MHQPSSASQPVAVPNTGGPRETALARVAHWAVIFGVVFLTGNAAREAIHASLSSDVKPNGKVELAENGMANVEGGHFTFTNLHPFTATACLKGVVTNVKTHKKVETVPVCTGELKPRSTIRLLAPYDALSLADVCPDETSRFGGVSWENCTFRTEEIP